VGKNGQWSRPEIAPFSGRYMDADPYVTSDGKQLFFISNRPVDPKSEQLNDNFDIR
jgi:WD40-like Beta Propeller Repeat